MGVKVKSTNFSREKCEEIEGKIRVLCNSSISDHGAAFQIASRYCSFL